MTRMIQYQCNICKRTQHGTKDLKLYGYFVSGKKYSDYLSIDLFEDLDGHDDHICQQCLNAFEYAALNERSRLS